MSDSLPIEATKPGKPPVTCQVCKTPMKREVGGQDFDEKGWFTLVTYKCPRGHETTERISHTTVQKKKPWRRF